MSLYEKDIIDIIIENKIEIIRFIKLLIFINKNISGIVPITDDKKIFFRFVILVNNKLTPSNIT